MRRRLCWALAGAALALAVGVALTSCGGGEARAIKIGVLSDCVGSFAAFNDLILAAAELPLLERGARLAGPKPSSGVRDAKVAGRRIDLLTGCTSFGAYRVLIAEARRLLEQERVDVLVGPFGESDGLVLREIARRHPRVAFVLGQSRTQEATLRDPAPNVFRFELDSAQQSAGLGSYAYHELGWRTAAVVGEDFATGWPRTAGFVAEFCALGGRVVTRLWPEAAVPTPAQLASKIPRHVDGVALVPAEAFLDWSGFVRAYARIRPNVSRHVVLGPEALILPANRLRAARLAPGIVGADFAPYDSTNPVWLRIRREFGRSFPGVLPPRSEPAEFPLVVAHWNAMEATLEALERAGGDVSGSERRFMRELRNLELAGPTGRIRLDRNRQAIGPAYLSRVELGASGKPVMRTVRVVPDVEQTFGGYFSGTTPPPSTTSPACRRATPPPWARAGG